MGDLSDAARESMNANADEVTMEKPETPAPEATPPPEGEVKAEVEAKVDEAAPPEFTAEQIAALAADPRVADAVLKGTHGKDTLESLLNEVLAEKETTAQHERVKAEQAKTIEEAIRQYDETGDASAFGELALKRYRAAQEAAPIAEATRAAVASEKDAEFLQALNETAQSTYPEVIEALTEADYGTLARQEGEPLKAWSSRGFKFLADKQRTMLQSGADTAVQTAEEAAKTAAAAAQARAASGVGVLPGGTGVEKEAGGDTIGGLIRQSMKDAIQYEE